MARRQCSDDEFLPSLLGRIYEGALDPRGLTDVLALLSARFGAAGATLLSAPRGVPEVLAAWGHDHCLLEAYAAHYVQYDYAWARATRLPAGTVLDDRELLTAAELKASPFYNELLASAGLSHILGLSVTSGADCAVLTFHRGARRGRPREDERRLLRVIKPHLVRAMQIQRAFEVAVEQRSAAWQLLDRSPCPIILVDSAGRFITANRAGELWLAEKRGISLVQGRVAAATSSDTSAVLAHLRAATTPSEPRVGAAVRISRACPATPLSVLIVPFSGDAGLASGHRRLAALVVTDADLHRRFPSDLSQRLFGLSVAENRLACALVEGLTLTEAARHFGVSRETVRAQLKGVFAKTGVSRQADLLGLLIRCGEFAGEDGRTPR